jgi:hypothetical protein
MKLLCRTLLCGLGLLLFSAATTAQTLRPANDPRNQSPSVGTGGPEGGPTGLFTIYDGDTIRKGEFTFSVAYSNYDRDPGNADFTDVPLSFNVGLNDHVELFFKMLGYRGLKVNTPQNLSSFYLPNSQLMFPALGSGPAIILSPNGPNPGVLRNVAIFRPAFNQPFVQFPFIGGPSGLYGLTAVSAGIAFGFPGAPTLGPSYSSPGSGRFGPADAFPGIGSPVGSILPGIVLATTFIPCTALAGNCRPPAFPGPLTPVQVPTVFTIAPTYLPDAPFINRLYGESAFDNSVIGAKIRLTGVNNPLGVALVPFYRWYGDKGNSFKGFNQMQRGAGPGGSIGDFGLVGVVDARLSRSVNVSANVGYILNSNPTSNQMGNGTSVLLDRPNELLAGIGFDFPLNKHFQPIAELRSTQYVAGRTPNAFENSPVELLAGVKLYPARWWGLGLAYRRHLNPQDRSHFNTSNFGVQIQQVTNVNVPGPPPRGIVVVPGTTIPATNADGTPQGFVFSDDPNGFLVQLWAGHRNPRFVPPTNMAPTVSLAASMATVTLPCPEGTSSTSCTPSSQTVTLTSNAADPDNDTLLYTYSVTGGKISGDGRSVSWDLSGLQPGTYTGSVEVNDGNNHTAAATTTVTVAVCTGCIAPCPNISVSCPDSVDQGSPITFTANVVGGNTSVMATYNWSVSAGTISSGQGTSTITVDTGNIGGQTVTATVEVGGYDPACGRTASCSTAVRPPPAGPVKFDEYGNIKFNDEKARLDNYAIQLQNQPGSTGYIIAYGSCAGEAQARADRAKNYLVNTRGIDAGRIVTVDGGCRSDLTVQLWVVPTGATPPAADTSNNISPCPACKKTAAPRRRGRRGRRGDDDE